MSHRAVVNGKSFVPYPLPSKGGFLSGILQESLLVLALNTLLVHWKKIQDGCC